MFELEHVFSLLKVSLFSGDHIPHLCGLFVQYMTMTSISLYLLTILVFGFYSAFDWLIEVFIYMYQYLFEFFSLFLMIISVWNLSFLCRFSAYIFIFLIIIYIIKYVFLHTTFGVGCSPSRNDKWRNMNAELTTFILKNVGSSELVTVLVVVKLLHSEVMGT